MPAWPKGVSGNPVGRPKLPAEVLELKETAKEEMLRVMAECLLMSRDELFKYLDPKTLPNESAAKLLAARVLIKAISDGCPIRAQFYMNYILGKPKPHDEAEVGRKPIRLAYPEDPKAAPQQEGMDEE